jgi:hypothetical protein
VRRQLDAFARLPRPRARRINREWTRRDANKRQLFVSIRVHSRLIESSVDLGLTRRIVIASATRPKLGVVISGLKQRPDGSLTRCRTRLKKRLSLPSRPMLIRVVSLSLSLNKLMMDFLTPSSKVSSASSMTTHGLCSNIRVKTKSCYSSKLRCLSQRAA